VHYCIWFSALNVLAGALGRREAGRVHCVEAVFQPTMIFSLLGSIIENFIILLF